jgi:glyceraldehyde 3-phosphate dehydrogenase
MIRIAINGFGRIGKTFLRTLLQDPVAQKKVSVVAINLGPNKSANYAFGFKYDTVMGTFPGTVSQENNQLRINDTVIEHIFTQADPAALPWAKLNIDWVVECSGHFTKRAGAQKHLDAGAKNVLISAPATDEDVTIIPGVSSSKFDAAKHHIISLGSCTTNALIPTVDVLHKTFGITSGFMSTVHAVTNTQALLDVELGDPRRSRAAMLNIVPTTTGAMDVIGKIYPDLGKVFGGHSIRVPVAKVSLLDLAVTVQKPVSVEAVHKAFHDAHQGYLKGILSVTKEPLVSSDYSGNPHSVVIDETLTGVTGNFVKVFGWYDNEWGYSERLKDFLLSRG